MNIRKSFRVVFFPRPSDAIERELERTELLLLIAAAQAKDAEDELQKRRMRYLYLSQYRRSERLLPPALQAAHLEVDVAQRNSLLISNELIRLAARRDRLQAKLEPKPFQPALKTVS